MTQPKRRVAIVTDSAGDIPADMAAEHDIEVIQLSVTLNGVTRRGNEIESLELLKEMESSGALATTSLPPIGEFIHVYEEVLTRADEIISIHVSDKLSGTFNAACKAAEHFAGRVHTFDTLSLSAGQGLQALYAANQAKAGATVAEIVEKLEKLRVKTRQVCGVDTFDYLLKGGRVSKTAAFVGSILNLKVAIQTDRSGRLVPALKARGDKAAVRETVKWVQKQFDEMGCAPKGKFAIGYLFNTERAEAVRQAVVERFDAVELYMYEAGPVISTHTGPGWGVAFYPVD